MGRHHQQIRLAVHFVPFVFVFLILEAAALDSKAVLCSNFRTELDQIKWRASAICVYRKVQRKGVGGGAWRSVHV